MALPATTTMLIRPAVEADYPRWLPLWDGYNAFYGRRGATALPRAVTELTWQRFFDPSEPVYALVAEDAGVLVGFAHYLFHRSTVLADQTCYLQDLFTAEYARGRGIARALIASVYGKAAAAGSPRVYWHTDECNAAAIHLYEHVAERSGFIVFRKSL